MEENEILNPQWAMGAGYSESKWIGERILAAAAGNTTLKPTVVRLGQITGNQDGYWNEREWLPAIIKSATVLDCLPDMTGVSALAYVISYKSQLGTVGVMDSFI